jgi:hypothetical protein
VANALALCLKKKIRRWTKERYEWRPQYTHKNLMTDLWLSEPDDYKIFCGCIFAPTIAKRITNIGETATISVYPLRRVIWQLEMLLKT